MTDLRILCASDLHLGRAPARLGGAGGVPSHATWRRLVDLAVRERVDAVLLGGDLIDELNRSFEAWGPLDRGLRELKDAGIPVVAVAGNHDFDSLPDVAAEVAESHLILLGREGRWETWTLRDPDGAARLQVVGWSFPTRHVIGDPTDTFALDREGDMPVLGLLHCDLNQPGGRYAPVSSSRLREQPVTAWILGHIHVPSLDQADGVAPILYPGGLQAMDPGETGARGAWMVTVPPEGRPDFRFLPLSATRYEAVGVDLDGVESAAEVSARIRTRVRAWVDREVGSAGEPGAAPPVAAWLRLHLHGRTRLSGGAEGDAAEGMRREIERGVRGIEAFDPSGGLELDVRFDPAPIIDTRPDVDLAELARGGHAPGELARLLIALGEDGGAEGDGTSAGASEAMRESGLDPDLIERAVEAARGIAARNHFAAAELDRDRNDPEAHVRSLAVRALRDQARALLDRLLAQQAAR